MIVVSVGNIVKEFPGQLVLSGLSWEIGSGEKIALVGKNGSGKTTLLGALSGRLEIDGGHRAVGKGCRIVELAQTPDESVDEPLLTYVKAGRDDLIALQRELEQCRTKLAETPDDAASVERLGACEHAFEVAGGYDWTQDASETLSGLGFCEAQFAQSVAEFSGGERTRAELARCLMTPADLRLFDEPTNHLDIPAVEWLERRLIAMPEAVVLVSHDRVFLERFAGKVCELRQGKLDVYHANYTGYRAEREQRFAKMEAEYNRQTEYIKRIEDFIQRNIAGQKTKQAQSRRKMLGKLERAERPQDDTHAMKLDFAPRVSSYLRVLEVQGFGKAIGERLLLDDVNTTIERGDKIGLIGPNGCGKTTLLRCIVGLDRDYDGRVRRGERVETAYFDQHLSLVGDEGTVIDEIWDDHPAFDAYQLRSYLARFLFRGEDVFKPLSALSGGERNRLALLKMMLKRANFLVLDEPTNHLDIPAREVLESALAEYDGTVLAVSHDRRFLDAFCTKVFVVERRDVTVSLGNYTEWARRRDEAVAAAAQSVTRRSEKTEAAADWEERKAERARRQKHERRVRELEGRIADVEARVAAIDAELAGEDVAREWERLGKLSSERERLLAELGELMPEWERVQGEGAS